MQDDQLIFMISLPRSGSTLLQKILGGHSDIYTRSEPWLMLHPLYAFKTEGIQTRYNAKLAVAGVQNFLQELPAEDENYYFSRIRDCYLSLYAPYLSASGKERFLDKTPRYYEIFDELQKTFPRAKFIVLYRNPLAVFASILETWVKGNYEKLKNYQCDLYAGVEFLQRDFTAYANTHVIRYEELLLNPEGETAALFDFLKLPNQPDCIDYGHHKGERWMYGDPETVYKKTRPDSQHIDAWHKQLAKPEECKLISDYLHSLGATAFTRLGYSFGDAEKAVANARQQHDGSPDSGISLSNLLLSDAELVKQVRHSNSKLREDIAGHREQLQTLHQQLGALEAELVSKQARIDELHGEIRTYEVCLSDRDRQIQSRDEHIQARDAQIKERDAQLQERDTQLRERDLQICHRDEQLKSRDEQIQVNYVHLQERMQDIQDRDTQLHLREERINALDVRLFELSRDIQERDAQLRTRDEQMQTWYAQLQEANLQICHRDQQIQRRDEQLAQRDSEVRARDALLMEHEQLIQTSEARLKACDQQIQMRDEQLKLLNDQLVQRDNEVRARDALLMEYEQLIQASEARLKACDQEIQLLNTRIAEHDMGLRHANDDLKSILMATCCLTEHRGYIRPLKKLRAYKELLSQINVARKKHTTLLKISDKQ